MLRKAIKERKNLVSHIRVSSAPRHSTHREQVEKNIGDLCVHV